MGTEEEKFHKLPRASIFKVLTNNEWKEFEHAIERVVKRKKETMLERIKRLFFKEDCLPELIDGDCPHWCAGRCMMDNKICIGYHNCVSLTIYKIT